MKLKLSILGLVLVLAAGLVFAQSDRATISGTVQDSSGAVLPGVQVQVTHVGTNDAQTVTTGDSGIYAVKNLPIGSYVVTFTKNGFTKLERKGVTLAIGQVASIDAVLKVGAQSETVTVSAEAPVLQTETTNITHNYDNKAVNQLPINVAGGRMLASVMFNYTPGVEGSDYSSHINGSVALSKEVMIDGISAVSQLGGYISETQPPMEGVEEFQVETAGIDADAGRTGGGIFRYEMKSGTNTWHATAFGFLHHPDFDALSANAHLSAITDPNNANVYLSKHDSMSDWGVSGGGAIVKNKLFFYSAYERYMQSNWNIGVPGASVPTDAMMGMNADGSFAQYADLSAITSAPIYNPVTHQQYANQLIPTADFSPTTKQLLQIYHQYYAPETNRPQNNAMPATVPWNHIDEFSTKLDYNLSDKHRINGSYIYNYTPRILADQGGIWSPSLPNGGPFANSYEHDTRAPSVRMSDSYNFSSTLINSFRFAVNRFYNPSVAKSQTGDWSNVLGLGPGIGNFPRVSFNNGGWYGNCCMKDDAGNDLNHGWNFGGLGSQFNDFYAANTIILSDDISMVRGRHTLKLGGEFRAMQFNSHGDFGVYNVTFDPLSTGGGPGYNKSGSAWASFLLGYVSQGGMSEPANTYGRRKAFSVYGSDTIKVTSQLTMNLDLRWDYNSPYKEKYGHWSNFDITKTNPVTGLMGTMEYLSSGSQSFEKKQDYLNFAPHVGFAYQATPKTVIRGGYSIFYVPLNMNDWAGIPYGFNPGFHDSNAAGAFQWDGGYQGTITNNQNPDYTQWGMVYIDPRSLTPGNSQQWTIGIQRELTKDMKIDVSFVETDSYHLHSGFLETNQPHIQDIQKSIVYDSHGNPSFNVYDPAFWPASFKASDGANGYYSSCIWGGWCPNYLAYTPYPQAGYAYGPLFSVGAPLGNGSYKALQTTISKRASHGLSLQGSYVYSRTRGDVDTSLNDLWWAGNIQNVYDLAHERQTIAGYDMTHIVKGYVLYDLPFGRGKLLGSNAGSVLNNVIGGWTVDLGFHYNTGTPIQLKSTNGIPGFNSIYVNLVPGCKLTTGNTGIDQTFLNTACFQNPDFGQLGTAGNFIEGARNPGMATEDMSLHKGFKFGERYNLTFRADFFNVFNRHQAGGPVTGMTDPNYGKVITYGGLGGRQGQVGARLTF